MVPNLNAQTAIDLQEARDKTSFDLQTIRDYLFGDYFVINASCGRPLTDFGLFDIAGRHNWESFEQVESILRKEPVFDKSSRCA